MKIRWKRPGRKWSRWHICSPEWAAEMIRHLAQP